MTLTTVHCPLTTVTALLPARTALQAALGEEAGSYNLAGLLQATSQVDEYECIALAHALHESPSVKIPGGHVKMYYDRTRVVRVSLSQNPRWTCKDVPQSHTRGTSILQFKSEVGLLKCSTVAHVVLLDVVKLLAGVQPDAWPL